MAGKRKYGQDSPEQGNKSRHRPTVEPRVDPTYGQRSAIPGLDDDTIMEGEEEWMNYDDDGMDALAYLRSVRQEATGIPNLLVAPKSKEDYSRDIYENGVGDFRVRYEDGAYYTSGPVPLSDDSEESGKDPQLAYFESILTRFEALRVQLSQTPPQEVVNALDKDHPIHVGKLNVALSRWWRWRMKTVDPLPAQIASMDKITVLRLLGLLTEGTMLKRGMEVDVGVSRWVWGLLARLPERGELISEEIGVVRDLGKKAVLVGMGLMENNQWEEGINEVEASYEDGEEIEDEEIYANQEEIQLDEDADNGDFDPSDDINGQQIGPQLPIDMVGIAKGQEPDGIREGNGSSGAIDLEGQSDQSPVNGQNSDIDFAAAKVRLLAQLNEPEFEETETTQGEQAPAHPGNGTEEAQTSGETTKWNTRATVDMIITVAGEVFGQRDLLEFRSVWGEVS